MRFQVPGLNADQFAAARKVLYYKDVNDNEYSADLGTLDRKLHRLGYFPGSGDSPFMFPGSPY